MNYNDKFSSFYNSKKWHDLRNFKWQESNGLCEKCLAKGIVKEGVEVHHLVEISKDWNKRFDYNNLILLCKECHQEMHERSGSLNEFLKIWDKGE